MKTTRKKYNPEVDFIRVRDFLVETYSSTKKPLNWKLERWNYARYYITPMLVANGINDPNLDAVEAAIHLWNDSIALWENETGKIVSVVNIEHPDKTHPGWGEVFFQHHPDYDDVLPEMLEYAETHLRNREIGVV